MSVIQIPTGIVLLQNAEHNQLQNISDIQILCASDFSVTDGFKQTIDLVLYPWLEYLTLSLLM